MKLKYKCLAADQWSLYPATSDVNMACNDLTNVGGVSFCDTTASISDGAGQIDLTGQFVFEQPPQTAVAPTGPDDLVNKAYADNNGAWSTHPAMSNVDMSCNSIINVGTIELCDGTTMGARVSDPTVFDISANDMLVVQSVGTGVTASMILDGSANTITFSTPPIISTAVVASADQLVPRTYLDNLIRMALPAIAGYLPGTCYSGHKNVSRVATVALQNPIIPTPPTLPTIVGTIVYLYPLVNTTISRVIFYAGSTPYAATNPIVANRACGFSLVEFDDLSSTTSGICRATTGNLIGQTGDNAPPTIASRRYAYNLRDINGNFTSYTLVAGKRYGITIARDGSGGLTAWGVNVPSGWGAFNNGIWTTTPPPNGYKNEVMSAGTYGFATASLTSIIPPVDQTVTITAGTTYLGIPLVGLEP